MAKITGHVKVWKNGELVAEGANLVVTAGKELIAALLAASGSTRPSHMACGSSTTAAALGQTALQGTEHERVALDSTTRSGATVTYEASLGSGILSAVTIAEFGIFNASSGGTMLCRFTSSEITFAVGDTLDVSWALTIGD